MFTLSKMQVFTARDMNPFPFRYFCFFFSLLLFFSPPAKAAEQIIVDVTLNQQQKGEFFAMLTEEGDFLFKEEDLRTIGFEDPKGTVVQLAGEAFISLRSMSGVEFIFNEKTLSVEISAPPSLLPKTEIDFLPPRQSNVLYSKDNSAFLNYRLNRAQSVSPDLSSLNLANELGVRNGEYLFLSDSSYTRTNGSEKFVRLMTNITRDRRDDLGRYVAGDFFASSGDLGGGVNLGGFSYAKIYGIDPYFIKYPLPRLSGAASFSSDVEVYLDGMRIRTEKLPPGEFELKNMTGYGGAGRVEALITDAFGRVRRIELPFYFTDTLLRKGLHEYSYNIGFIREDFGAESNHYGGLAASFFHKYGMSERLTLGFRGEGKNGIFNLGPEAICLVGNSGTLAGAVALGSGAGGSGAASSLAYSYQSRRINTRSFVRWFTEKYSTIADELNVVKPRYEAGAGIGYSKREFGSLSLDYARTRTYTGNDLTVSTVTYSKSLPHNVSLFLTFRNIRDQGSSTEVFVGINVHPGKETSVSAQYRKSDGGNTEALQVQKNPPVAEGFGYRATFESTDAEDGAENRFNPFVQYNSRYGIVSAEYDAVSHGPRTSQLTAAGAVVYVGGTFGLTRPVNDSFGLVNTGGLEGIMIYQNGQEMGRTDRNGNLFIPDLGSYSNNQISIEDKDIPMNYSIPGVVQYVSPPLRSGALLSFDVARFQAITGKLKVKIGTAIKPVEYYDIVLKVEGREETFFTGKDGEFYMENMQPGRYEASFGYYEKECSFDIIVPESDEIIVDLGVIACEKIN